MKRHPGTKAVEKLDRDEILPGYDFTHAQPNKYATQYRLDKTQAESGTKETPSHRRPPGNNGKSRKSTASGKR